jgi:hypothetical protein
MSPGGGGEIPSGAGQSVVPDQGLRPVVPPTKASLTAEQNREAVQQQTQESLLYGIAAGQAANPNLIHRIGEQSAQESPQEGNPALVYGVGAASQESKRKTQGTYTYTQDGKTVGRSQTTGDITQIYGADGRVSGKEVERGDTIYYYDAKGRQTGMAKK